MRNVVATRLGTVAWDARALAAVAALVLAAVAAPGAAAADACPNATIREQQGATALPDCRAYELVSPPQKNGNAVQMSYAARPDGGAIAFNANGAFVGAQSSISANYVSRRTERGWVTTAHNPPTRYRNPTLVSDQFMVAALSADYSRMLVETGYPVDPRDEEVRFGTWDLYRSEIDGGFTWITHGVQLPFKTDLPAVFGAATADLDRVAFTTSRELVPLPDGARGTQQVYVRDGDQTTLVSVGADGRALDGGALFANDTSNSYTGLMVGGRSPSALSADGSTVVFSNAVTPRQLYVRTDALDPARATTRKISASQASGSPNVDCDVLGATFLVATDDARTIAFGCPRRLTDDAPANGGLYMYDIGSERLRYVAGSADATSQLAFQAADRDLDHLYFVSRANLAAEADGTGRKLYLLHDGRISLLANFRSPSTLVMGEVALSPDGSKLVFESTVALDEDRPTDPRTRPSQIYFYDAAAPDAGPVCVSCRLDGAVTTSRAVLLFGESLEYGKSNRIPPSGNVSADGRRVFFSSAEALAPGDVNQQLDAYMYEDGRHFLLSSGRSAYPSMFGTASADGENAFVLTNESLVAQDVDNGVADVYAVRVGGGFPVPPETPDCDGDCQGPPQASPTLPEAGTATFTGPGDVEERAAPETAPVFSVAGIGARQRAAWAKRGRTTLTVRVSEAGRVRALVRARIGKRSVRVASASKTARAGGNVRLTLRLSGRARAHLRRQGALRLGVAVIWSRVRGAQRASLTLRAPDAAKAKGGRR